MAGSLGIMGLAAVPLCSCAPLPEGTPPGEVQVMTAELPRTGSVPAEWGSLVAVTPIPETTTSRLWFQDDSGTVRIVSVDYKSRRLWPQAVVIRRQ
jgi:hypothetical protein